MALSAVESTNSVFGTPRTLGLLSQLNGLEPIFLTVASQQLFGVVPQEDFNLDTPYKKISKEEILSDIEGKGVLSDFYGIKEKIEVNHYHLLKRVC